jgi:UMF1 family MFS transporter
MPMFLFTPDSPGAGACRCCRRARGRRRWSTVRGCATTATRCSYLIAFMLYNDGWRRSSPSAASMPRRPSAGARDARHLRHHPDGVRHSRRLPGGKLDDLIGSKRTVQFAIAGVIVATHRHRRRHRRPRAVRHPGRAARPTRAMFGSLQEKVFMAFALLLGFCMGPMQAASRTMIGRIAPPA